MARKKTKKFKGFHNLSAGLFGYRGWRWYKNIGDLEKVSEILGVPVETVKKAVEKEK